jgi:rhodanese-related sulfurtransferase
MVPQRNTITKQPMSFFGGKNEVGITNIDRAAMTEIIEDVVNSSREESGYVIIDVRGQDEIQSTGRLNDVVVNLPLPYIAQGALVMDEEDFKEAFGFEKPQLDETLVFSCKAGIRSQQAGQLAKMAGYSNILNYMGGANEWFS